MVHIIERMATLLFVVYLLSLYSCAAMSFKPYTVLEDFMIIKQRVKLTSFYVFVTVFTIPIVSGPSQTL